jgi:phage replication O-like protein O
MACPQKENGFTQIANEILEKLAFAGINGSEYRLLLVVFRKTYGFQKKKDKISLSQFQKFTNMNRANVVRTIKTLVAKRILLKEGNTYIFNKNWEEWVVAKRLPSSQKDTPPSSQMATKSSSQKDTHKRKKEIETKEMLSKESGLIPQVIKLFEGINPACKRYYGNTTQRKACQDLLDTYGFEVISGVIAFLPKNNSTPFMPKANTPLQLWDKFQSIKDAWLQQKNKSLSKVKGIA